MGKNDKYIICVAAVNEKRIRPKFFFLANYKNFTDSIFGNYKLLKCIGTHLTKEEFNRLYPIVEEYAKELNISSETNTYIVHHFKNNEGNFLNISSEIDWMDDGNYIIKIAPSKYRELKINKLLSE